MQSLGRPSRSSTGSVASGAARLARTRSGESASRQAAQFKTLLLAKVHLGPAMKGRRGDAACRPRRRRFAAVRGRGDAAAGRRAASGPSSGVPGTRLAGTARTAGLDRAAAVPKRLTCRRPGEPARTRIRDSGCRPGRAPGTRGSRQAARAWSRTSCGPPGRGRKQERFRRIQGWAQPEPDTPSVRRQPDGPETA